MSIISETINNDENELNEAFEQLTSFIKTNRFVSKDVAKSNKLLSNLTKQIWSRFYLYKKRQEMIAKNKGYSLVPFDKVFIQGFIEQVKADPEIKKNLYAEVGKEINALDKAYKGVRSGKVSKADVKERMKNMNVKPMVVMSHVINALALETTLYYMEHQLNMDLDYDSIDPENKNKMINSMGKTTSKIMSQVGSGLQQAVSDRANRK